MGFGEKLGRGGGGRGGLEKSGQTLGKKYNHLLLRISWDKSGNRILGRMKKVASVSSSPDRINRNISFLKKTF